VKRNKKARNKKKYMLWLDCDENIITHISKGTMRRDCSKKVLGCPESSKRFLEK
jgi:hypothetical protein